jgi:hypothetical protein
MAKPGAQQGRSRMTVLKKLAFGTLTAATAVAAFTPALARPAPHRHRVCHIEHHHGHAVRVCHWVR